MGKDKYPTPKRGERVNCLACNGSGRIVIINKGKLVAMRTCIACGGKGYFVA